jgi:hypothetical protein
MVAIAALADPTYARVRLTVTGAVEPDVTVERIGAGNVPVLVRNADPGFPISGTMEVYDYEAELNTPVTYRVTDGASTATTSTVTLTVTKAWLKAPHWPSLNTPVTFASQPSFSRSRPQGVHRVLNRSKPVVVYGTLGSKEGSLALLTGNQAAGEALAALLEATGVVLLQVPKGPVGALYLAVGDVQAEPFTFLLEEDTFRWSVGAIEVDRPTGALIGNPTATYQQLKDGPPATYTALKTTKTSYLDVMRGVGVPVTPPSPGSF